MRKLPEVWTIVLAGGEGSRVKDVPAQEGPIPKQFRRFRENRSLLQSALNRAMRSTPREHIVAVVAENHRLLWEKQLRGLAAENIISQPLNRGTAVAILLGLVHVLVQETSSLVAVLPSDHEVDEESILDKCLHSALLEARRWPEHIVALGMAPGDADPEYGWIVPDFQPGEATRGVRRFVEKPSANEAKDLLDRGALINCFIFAATGQALLKAFRASQPDLLKMILENLMDRDLTARSLAAFFEGLPSRDFGSHVMQAAPDRLRLLPVPFCGWSDLGTPRRIDAWKSEHARKSALRAG